MKIIISPIQRVFIFLLIIIVIPLLITNDVKKISLAEEVASQDFKSSKDFKWEYIKDRVTIEDGEVSYVRKGDILIEVLHATHEDSIALGKNLEELRKILPHKTIDYFSNQMEENLFEDVAKRVSKSPILAKPVNLYNSVLVIYFIKSPMKNITSTSILDNGVVITRDDQLYRRKTFGNRVVPESIFIHFPDTITSDQRHKYIRYELYRWLYTMNSNNQFAVSYNHGMGIFNNQEFIPDFNTLTSKDQFFLQKLYSDNFIDQFETYLYANYPWRYALWFMNKGQSKLIAYLVITFVLILFFLIVFPIFRRPSSRMQYVNYFISILAIYTSILYATNIYNYFVHLDINLTIFDSFLVPLIVVVVIAFMISVLLWSVEKVFIRNQNHTFKNYVLHFIFTTIALNIPLFFIMYFNIFYGRLEYMIPFALVFIALSLFRVVMIYLHRNSEMLMRAKDTQLSQLKELQLATELNSLHAQINPHFLYNALNSIASLAHVDPDKTEKMALSLSDLFRHSVNRKGSKLSTIKEEVTMVNNYLQIEKIRFEEDLEFSLNVEPSLKEVNIPRFILQPLIENSIKHGVSKIEEKGHISLDIYRDQKKLIIAVSDNGPNFPEGLVSGHGLQSVFDLLRLSYGGQASMNWENLPKKKITITITSSF